MRAFFHQISLRNKLHLVSVWVTKYRYPVLKGDVQCRCRCREIIIQICDAEDVQILKGVVSKDHIHMHIEYPARVSISDLVKRNVFFKVVNCYTFANISITLFFF